MAKVGRLSRALAALMALGAAVACRPATADPCAVPPPWRQVYLKPGQPDAELWGCLNDAAWEARAVSAPLDSKAAGLIAECEVGVDRFEGNAVFGAWRVRTKNARPPSNVRSSWPGPRSPNTRAAEGGSPDGVRSEVMR